MERDQLTELTREAQAVERWNMLHPQEAPKISYVQKCLQGHGGPVIAATDYVRMYAEQIRPFPIVTPFSDRWLRSQ